MGALGLFGQTSDDSAAEASLEAAQIQADYQREALDYLKEIEAVPQTYREAALTSLGSEYGITLDEEGNVVDTGESLTERVKSSEYYQALLSGQEAGEEAILRQASATGGLRSGNVQAALYDYNTQLENEAFINAYNQQLSGLQGLAGLSTDATSIANLTSSIGTTLSQGLVASTQAEQASQQQTTENLLSLATIAAAAFSDRRLKKNIVKVRVVNGHNWYRWDWNNKARELGFSGSGEGVIADEIEQYMPEAIIEQPNGYKTVDMGLILGV